MHITVLHGMATPATVMAGVIAKTFAMNANAIARVAIGVVVTVACAEIMAAVAVAVMVAAVKICHAAIVAEPAAVIGIAITIDASEDNWPLLYPTSTTNHARFSWTGAICGFFYGD